MPAASDGTAVAVTANDRAVMRAVAGAFGLDVERAVQLEGRTEVWLVPCDGVDVVLRRTIAGVDGASADAATRSQRWVHEQLVRVGSGAAAVPQPAPVFDGSSLCTIDRTVWEALTYLPGRVVGWDRRPTMFELGAFLAGFHDVASEVVPDSQRDDAVSVASLVEPRTWAGIDLSGSHRTTVLRAIECVGEQLTETGHATRPVSLVHGDATNHNVLTTGNPARPYGLIDFANAYRDVTLVDIAFALWRSGRSGQETDDYDSDRIRAYITGYSSVRALDFDERAAIAAYLMARGLQIVVRQFRRGAVIEPGPLRKLGWLVNNASAVRSIVQSAVA